MALQLNEKNIKKMIKNGERMDGRDFRETRDIEIIPNYVHETADGSALVKIGDTKVLVGISTELGDPYPDRPGQGAIITNAEFTAMASPEFESGPPREDAVELARLVDRGIRESAMVDLDELVIEEGEECWMVFIDVHVLDHNGNLLDAASLGAATALELADLPALDEDGNVDRDETQGPLPTSGLPMTVTGYKVAGEILYDTTREEEEVLGARLTTTFKDDGNVVAMQKGEKEPFSDSEVMDLLQESSEKAERYRELVRQAVEQER
jgi:exosome complex component RRP42